MTTPEIFPLNITSKTKTKTNEVISFIDNITPLINYAIKLSSNTQEATTIHTKLRQVKETLTLFKDTKTIHSIYSEQGGIDYLNDLLEAAYICATKQEYDIFTFKQQIQHLECPITLFKMMDYFYSNTPQGN